MSRTTSSKTPVLMGDVNINLDDGAAKRAVANMSTRGQQSFARALQAEGMRSATTGSLAACTPSRIAATPAVSARQPVTFGAGVTESVSMGSSRGTSVTLAGPSRTAGLALAVPAAVPVAAPAPAAPPTVSTIARAVASVVADEMERRNAQRNQGSGSSGRSGSVHVHHHNHYHRRRTRYAVPVVPVAPVVVEPAVYAPPMRMRGWGYDYCC